MSYNRFKAGLERRLIQPPAKMFWQAAPVVSLENAHDLIRKKIESRQPFCAARIGGVEASIVLWGKQFPKVGRLGIRLSTGYSDTATGATNAGIRPRTPESYKRFAELAFDSLKLVDLLEQWNSPQEFAVVRKLSPLPLFCNGEQLSVTMDNQRHWVESLHQKRVLVVSPFKSSIEKQIPRLDQVWRKRAWNWRAEFSVIKFPYLIDDDCPQSWQDVWQEISSVIKDGNYDVALFGCGGLGLPLAAAAKAAGRIGIHMGGHLQLIFGIYGQRHLEQDWHGRWINDAWIRPASEEVAKSARRVENGCYW